MKIGTISLDKKSIKGMMRARQTIDTSIMGESQQNDHTIETITNDLYKLLTIYETGDELEIRFGYYVGEYFRSCLSSTVFNKILKSFLNNEQYTPSYIFNTISMYSNGIRQIHGNKTTTNIKKIKKTHIDNRNLEIRIALSREKKLDSYPKGKCLNKSRIRYTFFHVSENHKIDLTIDTLPKSKQYQCEVEFTNKPDVKDIIKLINTIKYIINS